jgi:hypothetical protein
MRPHEDFNKGPMADGLAGWCRPCMSEYNRERRQQRIDETGGGAPKRILSETRAWVIAWKALAGCQHCGETDVTCLDLHHHDPAQKTFDFGTGIEGRSVREVQDEAEKCVVLCRNCHAKIHAGRFTLEDDREAM